MMLSHPAPGFFGTQPIAAGDRPRRSGAKGGLGALLLALAASSGCTLLVEPAVQCKVHSDCAKRGIKDTVCTSFGWCAPLYSTDCSQLRTMVDGQPLLGPLADDHLLLGQIIPRSGPQTSVGAAAERAVELALAEIDDLGVALPTGRGRGQRLAYLVCDEQADVERAARHLVDDLAVPLVMGAATSANTVRIATAVTIPGRTLLLTPHATSPTLTELPDRGLLWRTATSALVEPAALVAFALQAPIPSPLSSPRIGVLAKGDLDGRGLADGVVALLPEPGKPGSEIARRDYDLRSTPERNIAAMIDDPVAGLRAFRPSVVLVLGTQELLPVVEALDAVADPKPVFVLSEALRVQELRELIARRPALSSRLFLLTTGQSPTRYPAFQIRWGTRFPGTAADVYGATSTYDAVYLAAYSLATLRGRPPSGDHLAAGLAQLANGDPNRITAPGDAQATAQALALLAAGATINYDGVSGPLDFNPSTGDAANTFFMLTPCEKQFLPSNRLFDGRTWRSSGPPVVCPR